MNPFDIFIRACNFVIAKFYDDDFEKFYIIGLSHGRKKWKNQSLSMINEDMVFGFNSNELG